MLNALLFTCVWLFYVSWLLVGWLLYCCVYGLLLLMFVWCFVIFGSLIFSDMVFVGFVYCIDVQLGCLLCLLLFDSVYVLFCWFICWFEFAFWLWLFNVGYVVCGLFVVWDVVVVARWLLVVIMWLFVLYCCCVLGLLLV